MKNVGSELRGLKLSSEKCRGKVEILSQFYLIQNKSRFSNCTLKNLKIYRYIFTFYKLLLQFTKYFFACKEIDLQ